MTSKIEFVDLKKQYASIKEEIDTAMSAIVTAGAFVGGPAMESFDAEFAEYCEARYTISVANGTDALHLVLRAMGSGRATRLLPFPTPLLPASRLSRWSAQR